MDESKETKEQWYVNSIIERIKTDFAMAAALKRADNPATEYRAWEYLADYRVDLEKPWERIPYSTISAALARAKPEKDGALSLGEAIAKSGKDGIPSDQERSRLRRILACDTSIEVCAILRHLLSLIESRGIRISYGKLLNELVWFDANPQKIKTRWAQSFFRKPEEVE